jgi:glycerate kinase
MHILIAPNAFKNSLTAPAAAAAIEKGLHESKLFCTTECFPIADGGDGTAALIIQKLQGEIITVEIQDPLGRRIEASFGLIDGGKTAVIEMADASGLRLLKQHELNPQIATSYGTGQMIKKALDFGVKTILIAMGGTATIDGGTGILRALGVRFLNEAGDQLVHMPEILTELASVDVSAIDERLQHTSIIVLCDVDNKLLGTQGAAAVFGPQKGADSQAVEILDAGLSRFNDITLKQLHINMAATQYGGAAGGASAALCAWVNAKLVNGIDYFMELTGFDEALQKSDFVITGEGSIDEQTLQGKGPFGVASRAKANDVPVIGLAGKIPLHDNDKLSKYFDVLMAIGNGPSDIPAALNYTEQNLIRTSKNIASLLMMGIYKRIIEEKD